MKKITSIFVIISMLLSLLIVGVSADLSGAGTEASPYLIGTKADLEAFAAAPVEGAYYKLTADIVWSDYKLGGTAPAESNWTPVTFNGTFDGDGHTISGLYVKKDGNNVGFFAKVNGTVKNLTIKDSSFTGKTYVGAITGNTVLSTDKNAPTSIVIENCVSYASVTATAKNSYVGGIAGGLWCNPNDPTYLIATVTKCVNYGDVTSATGNAYAGGVVGRVIAMPGLVSECANFGKVTATEAIAGGIVGQISRNGESDSAFVYTISDCYNAGEVTASDLAGGIAGRGYEQTTIKNCVSVGKVRATKDAAVRFGGIDANNVATLNNNYYLEGSAANAGDATLVGTGNPSGATAKTPEDLQSAAMATALGDKWTYNTTDGLVLKSFATPATSTPEPTPGTGTTTETPTGTTKPADTTKPAPTPSTGDASAIVIAAVITASLAGVVIAKKKIER